MNETISVDQAISKGHRMVNLPVFAAMLGPVTACMLLAAKYPLPGWMIPVTLPFGIALAWLLWSILITRWKVWAFENVRNVHELKKRAVQENLIWPDGSYFEKTEIWTSNDRERWNSIQLKFKQKDAFLDDRSFDSETIIYYAKGKNFLEMAIMASCFVLGIFLLTKSSYLLGTVFAAFGAWAAYREFKQATNTEPQIILNDKGIRTASTPFHEWKHIRELKAIQERSGKYSVSYLTYTHPGGRVKVKIDDYDTNVVALNKILILYRWRYNRHSGIR